MDHFTAIDHSVDPVVAEQPQSHTVTVQLASVGGAALTVEVSLLYAERLAQRLHDATLALRTFDATNRRAVTL